MADATATPLLSHLGGRPTNGNANPYGNLNDGFALPHIQTFSGIVGGLANTYRVRFDEALRESEENALAMRRDGFLFELLRERQMPTCSAPWHIEPEDEDDPVQTVAAQIVTRAIQAIPRFTQMRLMLLEGLWYGKAGVQILPGKSKTRHKVTTVSKYLPVHGDKLVFRHDGTPGVLIHGGVIASFKEKGATILPTDRGMALFLDSPAWRERFLIHAHEMEDADYREPELAGKIRGVGLRDHCYWLWWLRNESAGWLLDYLGRVGAGGLTLVGYDEGNPASMAAARQTANDLQTGNVVLVPRPKGTDKATNAIERIEPSEGGSRILMDIVDQHFERKIERLFVGQSMSGGSDASDGLGGTGRAQFAADTKYQLVSYDADNLDDTLTHWLVEPILRWNLPGTDFQLRFKTDLAKPDPKAQLDSAKLFFDMGGELKEDEVREFAGLSSPEDGDKILSMRQQQQAGMMGMGMGGGPMGGPGGEPGGDVPPDGGPDGDGGEPTDESSPDIQAYFSEQVANGRLFDPNGLRSIRQELDSGAWQGEDEPAAPVQMARERASWSPYTNPETGQSGWKSANGRVVYEDPENHAEDAPHGRKPREQQQPADGPGEKVARHVGVQRGSKLAALPAQKHLEAMFADPSQVTPASMGELVDKLMGLRVEELRKLRSLYGAGKSGGRKAELADKLAGAVQGGAEARPQPAATTEVAETPPTSKDAQLTAERLDTLDPRDLLPKTEPQPPTLDPHDDVSGAERAAVFDKAERMGQWAQDKPQSAAAEEAAARAGARAQAASETPTHPVMAKIATLREAVQPKAATDKPKVEYVRAKAGGQVSDVDGKFYPGGQLMPIHGQYSGMERAPKGNGVGVSSEPVKPNEDAEGKSRRQPAQPMTPDEIEDRKRQADEQKKWDEMNAGPLGRMKWLGNSPNFKAMEGIVRADKWQEFAEQIGPEGVKRIVDTLEPQFHKAVDATEGADDEGKTWFKSQPRRFAEEQAGSIRGSKGHLKKIPDSHYARQLVQHMMDPQNHPKETSGVDIMHGLHSLLAGASTPAPSVATTANPDAEHAATLDSLRKQLGTGAVMTADEYATKTAERKAAAEDARKNAPPPDPAQVAERRRGEMERELAELARERPSESNLDRRDELRAKLERLKASVSPSENSPNSPLTTPQEGSKVGAQAGAVPAGPKGEGGKVDATTNNHVKVHPSGRRMMTREAANAVAAKFREAGGFTSVEVEEFGHGTGCFSVSLRSLNPASGNRNLYQVDAVPANDKAYKLLAKIARGKASERDKDSFARMAAEAAANNS